MLQQARFHKRVKVHPTAGLLLDNQRTHSGGFTAGLHSNFASHRLPSVTVRAPPARPITACLQKHAQKAAKRLRTIKADMRTKKKEWRTKRLVRGLPKP